jgi:hypothetical protein
LRVHFATQDGSNGRVTARIRRSAGWRTSGYFSRCDIEDCLTSTGSLGFWLGAAAALGSWGWRRRNRKEGTFVSLCVSDQRRDIVLGEERICEYLGRREPEERSAYD